MIDRDAVVKFDQMEVFSTYWATNILHSVYIIYTLLFYGGGILLCN